MRLPTLAVSTLLLLGCNQNGSIENPLPEIGDVSGPTGSFFDEDHKTSEAVAQLKGWTTTSIYFRYATAASEIKSVNATEIAPVCSGGQSRDCAVVFPNALSNDGTVFSVGTTVFYQWFVDYQLPDGNDVATAESTVGSFQIVQATTCVNDSQCSGGRVCAAAQLVGDPTTEQLVAKRCFLSACPIGANGFRCSGHGQCEHTTGECLCEPDYREADCSIVCQRCYGAAGNNCGNAEGDFGFCSFDSAFSLPDGMSMRDACEDSSIDVPNVTCQISVGSWTHDECCIRAGEFAPCSIGSVTSPDAVCQDEGNLAAGEILTPLLVPRAWQRSVDPCVEVCGVHGADAQSVRTEDMCASAGDTLSCTSAAAAGPFCCSGSASTTLNSGICVCN